MKLEYIRIYLPTGKVWEFSLPPDLSALYTKEEFALLVAEWNKQLPGVFKYEVKSSKVGF